MDWLNTGPFRDVEFAFGLNRHFHWMPLLEGWFRTGKLDYLLRLEAELVDWVTAVPRAPANLEQCRDLDGRDCWTMWRNLEVGLRLTGTWEAAFFALLHSDAVAPASPVLLLASVAEQAPFLCRFHGYNPNHLAMEMTGLALAALVWPEFKEAGAWVEYARRKIEPQMGIQIYPDGAQKELTSGYHLVALRALQKFAVVVDGLAARPMPAAFTEGLERMWNYEARTMSPDGCNVLNNDTDLFDLSGPLREAAGEFGRPDWLHIASFGTEDRAPDGLPSAYFPWCGQLVMRSGWGRDAHWGFFDAGPHGISGHQHYDKLHLSIAANGRPLLVDNGRFTHRQDIWRQYFTGSYGHNVILVNGHGQDEGIEVVVEPLQNHALVTPAFDFACGHFDTGYLNMQGECVHTRAVCYVRGLCWVVVDRMSMDTPRTIQPLWHFHPDCTVEISANGLVTTDAGKGNLRVVPVGGMPWKLQLVKGRESADAKQYRMWKADFCPSGPDEEIIQGWYSPSYHTRLPSVCAVYRADLEGSATFAWVLFPAMGPVPEIPVDVLAMDRDMAHMVIHVPGRDVETVMSLRGPAELRLRDGSVAIAACAVKG